MTNIEDSTGRKWLLHVTVGAVKRVRAMTNVDLFKLFARDDGQSPLYDKLCQDPVLLLTCAYHCLTDAQDKSLDDFLDSFTPAETEKARNAFLTELLGFFPQGPLVLKMMARQDEAEKAYQARVSELTNEQLDRALSSTLRPISTNSQE